MGKVGERIAKLFSFLEVISPERELKRLERRLSDLQALIDSFKDVTPESMAAGGVRLEDVLADLARFEGFLSGIVVTRHPRFRGILDIVPLRVRFEAIRIGLRQADLHARELAAQANIAATVRHALDAAESDVGTKAANARWARLEPVKAWAFEERRNNPGGSRAAFIGKHLATIKARAKEAGEPLTGDDDAVKATVARWFREAKIR